MKFTIIKTFITILWAISLVVLFVACGNPDSFSNNSTLTNNNPSVAEGIIHESVQNTETVAAIDPLPAATEPVETEPDISAYKEIGYENDQFKVEYFDGVYYLIFTGGNTPTEAELAASIPTTIYPVTFDSLEDMKTRFLTGMLTEKQVRLLKVQYGQTEKGIPIPDPFTAPAFTAPFDVTIQTSVNTYMTTYRQVLQTGRSGLSWIDNTPMNSLDHERSMTYDESTVISEETMVIDGVECTVIRRGEDGKVLRTNVIFRLDDPETGKAAEVRVNYLTDEPEPLNGTSQIYDIRLFGEQDGFPFHVFLDSVKGFPGMDWLRAFGVKPAE